MDFLWSPLILSLNSWIKMLPALSFRIIKRNDWIAKINNVIKHDTGWYRPFTTYMI
jgi:hypothetical protein